jgi:integrase
MPHRAPVPTLPEPPAPPRAFRVVRPTEKRSPRDGIRRKGAGWRATVSQGRSKPAINKQFPLETPRDVMQEWRKDTIAQLRVTRKARATQGAFSLDAEKYLGLEAVTAMPVFKTGERTRHIQFWVEHFGDRQRSEITKNEIENIYRRLTTTPRRAPQFKDPRRNSGRKPNPRPISIHTANKILRALSNLYSMLDPRSTPNPVREVEELKPPVVLADLDANEDFISNGRSIPYDQIEKILAAMPDVGERLKGAPKGKARANFSATKIRLRCMAYCQITEDALMRLEKGKHISFKARCVALAGRGKGKGAPPIWTPVTTKALAAFRDFDEHNLYGEFAASAVLRVWKRAAARVGLSRPRGYRVYDLRHSVATALKRVSHDGEAIDYLMQHKIQGTTIHYTSDSVPDRVREVVARLDAYQQQF